MTQRSLPHLEEVRDSLAQLATDDALTHLEAALRSMQGLSATLQSGSRLAPGEQRILERSLLRFRAELGDARVLAESGLSYCKDWADQLQPPPVYDSTGACATAFPSRHELSLEA